jgi:glycosyltransferase involved in cell wall biosynthesis
MAKSCRVSVVMPCFNHGEFLPEAVASVIHLERDDVELIVVDDGSTDERTLRELDDLVAQGIRVVRQDNKRLAAARNAGILASQGMYIFPLDADDRLRSGWLDRGIRILDSDPKVGIVYGDAQCFGVRSDLWVVGPFESARLYIGTTFTLQLSTVALFGNRIADMTALCPFKDWRTGISGSVLRSTAGNLLI